MALLLRDSVTFNRNAALPVRRPPAPGGVLPVGAKPLPFALPAGSAKIVAVPDALAVMRRTDANVRSLASYKLEAEPADRTWGITPLLSEPTSASGGSYAVRDVLAAQPRPRRRGSPLAAALVLRLDGQEDSPAFSIGGGGVAAAVWQVMPK